VAEVADVDEAVGDFELLLQPAAETEVTATAAVISAIALREVLMVPLLFDRVELGSVGHRAAAGKP
jgi:hypothetical protein